jgi:ketosteroid isomerase-like protein
VSRENVEVIRASYEALNRRDYDAWLSNMHPDIELHELASSPDAAIYRGHSGARKWVENTADEAWEEFRIDPEQFTEADDFVIVSVRLSMRGRGSSVPLEARLFHVIEMSEGKGRRVWGYQSEDEALEAVGLRE